VEDEPQHPRAAATAPLPSSSPRVICAASDAYSRHRSPLSSSSPRCILKLAHMSAVSASCLHLPPPLSAKGRREAVAGSRLMGRPAAICRRLRGAEGRGRHHRRDHRLPRFHASQDHQFERRICAAASGLDSSKSTTARGGMIRPTWRTPAAAAHACCHAVTRSVCCCCWPATASCCCLLPPAAVGLPRFRHTLPADV
jgi:hypothetical protein